MDIETDLVVVGSGAAGCGAALAGVLRGLRVVLVEKSDRLGGATAASLGGLWVPDNHLMAGPGWRTASTPRGPTRPSSAAATRCRRWWTPTWIIPRSRCATSPTRVPFRLLRGLPDHYYPQAEGSSADGRMVEAMPITRDAIAPWGDRLEEGVHNEAGVSWGDAIAWGGLGARQRWPEEEIEARRQRRLLAAGPALVGAVPARADGRRRCRSSPGFRADRAPDGGRPRRRPRAARRTASRCASSRAAAWCSRPAATRATPTS